VNSLPKTVTRERRGCDFNLGPSAPESSTLTTRLQSHPYVATCIHEITTTACIYILLSFVSIVIVIVSDGH